MGNGESSAFTRCPGGSTVMEEGGATATAVGMPLDSNKLAKLKSNALTTRETPEARLQRYLRALTVSKDKLEKMTEEFLEELQLGLELHREAHARGTSIDPKVCSFKMLDSHVTGTPSGEEKGVVYAIDFGGTNFRAVRCEMQGNGKIATTQYQTSLTSPENSSHPRGLMDKKATATEMFDFFAVSMKKFLESTGDLARTEGAPYSVGFTFSFPATQRKLDSAIHVVWTKEFETGNDTKDPVVGQDVGELLDIAFQRNNVPMKVKAVMNDTVGTLLSCAYEKPADKPPCMIGIILGTGMNACYVEEGSSYYSYTGNIINIECGNFNRALPRTNVDMECDFQTSNRGGQLLEKMSSGAYLGELSRRAIVKVLQSQSPPGAWELFSLSSEDAANIAADESPNALVAQKSLKRVWNADLTQEQCVAAQKLCYAMFDRGAACAAVIIAACARKSGHLQPAMGGLTVGVDGSLYKCNPFYRRRLRHYLEEILADAAALIHIELADDGSGKGAAVIAAM